MKKRPIATIAVWAGLLFLFCGSLSVSDAAETRRSHANITYRIPEGVYINIGTDAGLRQGLTGAMVLEDGRTLAFEVVHVARSTALLRLQGVGENLVGGLQARPVELVFDSKPEEREKSEPAGKTGVAAEPFVPLLTPIKRPPDYTPTQNISHGNIGIRQTYQGATDNQLDYAVTRLYTSGDIDRLFGSAWSFVWSGSARYRTGDGYSYHSEYNELQPLVYTAMLQHPLAGDGFVRMGRFLPLELPGIGYIDGGQIELDQAGHWSFGAVGGLKPKRINLEFSGDEPTVVGYATFEAGQRGTAYYSGTAGLLGSLYKGEADRLAVLFDQRADLGPLFDLYSTTEFDLGLGSTTNSQAQISRFDLVVTSRMHSLLTLRAGANHWQRTDTLAQRDEFLFVDDSLFDEGFWRYWAGARHKLPWKLNLNEELSYIVSDATDDAMRWRIGMTRSGLLGWTFANVGATLYNLEAQGSSGYGGLLRAYLPFWDGRLAISPSAGLRWLDPDNGGEGLDVTYYTIHFDGRITKAWMLSGGVTSIGGDGADALLFDLGLRYSW